MRATIPLTTLVVGLAIGYPLEAQNLADRVNSARSDIVRLSFPTRPEICGDGKSIGETTADGFVTHTFWSGGYSINRHEFWEIDCRQGPMRLVVERRNGRVTELRVAVGVDWLPDAAGIDLGTFSGAEVATWLLDVAEADEDLGSVAFLAANAALDAPIANRLIAIARDDSNHPDVRQRAIRWLNRAALREGMSDRADQLLRELALARSENVEVRERAIRSLRKTDENDDWLREQYASLDRAQLRERVIRRIGESHSTANADWLRELALETSERGELRERALRVIGEQPGGRETIRELYGRLDRSHLKERALRVVGEESTTDDTRWIRGVAEDRSERMEVRERAVRILAEGASLSTLQQLYREVDGSQLKERVLRLAGERRSRETADWLEQVAADRSESLELRERAIRLLGEYESTAVRDLFESLDRNELKDRALRIAADRDDPGTTDWLTDIAMSTEYSTDIRDRALRLLGERAVSTNALASLYDEVRGTELRRRVIRILAERNDDTAAEKLREIAETDPSRELRRYAMRRLAEMW
jgi:hypothetical protein